MGGGAHPPDEPLRSRTGSGLGEPICLPVLRRPLGWRELDSKTLLLRAHGLIATQCKPIVWDQVGDSPPPDTRPPLPSGQASSVRQQLPSSEQALGEAWSRIQAIYDSTESELEAQREAPTPKGARYSGWLLTASLVLVALQMALFLVAISPIEVIEGVTQSLRQWQIARPEAGAAGPGSPSFQAASPSTERANWWAAWQQTSLTGALSSSDKETPANAQQWPQATEVKK